MTTLLAIDPGGSGSGTTGIVLLSYRHDVAPVLDASWSVRNALDGWLDWCDTHAYLEPDVVVCEHFVNRNVPGADLTPCFIEGSVRTVYRHTTLQPAAGKNTMVPDDKMNRLGFTRKQFSGDNHSDRWEALRHGLWYLRKNRHLPTLRGLTT